MAEFTPAHRNDELDVLAALRSDPDLDRRVVAPIVRETENTDPDANLINTTEDGTMISVVSPNVQDIDPAALERDEAVMGLGDIASEVKAQVAEEAKQNVRFRPAGNANTGGFAGVIPFWQKQQDEREARALQLLGGATQLKSYARQTRFELVAAELRSEELGHTPDSLDDYRREVREILDTRIRAMEEAQPGSSAYLITHLEVNGGREVLGSLQDDLTASPHLGDAMKEGDLQEALRIFGSVEHHTRMRNNRNAEQLDKFRDIYGPVVKRMEDDKSGEGQAMLDKLNENGLTIAELQQIRRSKWVDQTPGGEADIIGASTNAILEAHELVSDLFTLSTTEEGRQSHADQSLLAAQRTDGRRAIEAEAKNVAAQIIAAGEGVGFHIDMNAAAVTKAMERISAHYPDDPTAQIEARASLRSLIQGFLVEQEAASAVNATQMTIPMLGLDAITKFNEGGLASLTPRDRAILMHPQVDRMFIDPVVSMPDGSPVYIYSQDPAEDRKHREAIGHLRLMMPKMHAAFKQLEETGNFVDQGGWLGLDAVQIAFRDIGIQSQEAALYMSMSREFVSIFLKARQGSRPSDFDMMFYLSLLPTLSEVRSGSASGRFANMMASLEMEANSVFDPETQRYIMELKEGKHLSPEMVTANLQMEQQVNLFRARMETARAAGDQSAEGFAYKELGEAQQIWMDSGAGAAMNPAKFRAASREAAGLPNNSANVDDDSAAGAAFARGFADE